MPLPTKLLVSLFLISAAGNAQSPKLLTLNEAVELGLKASTTLKSSAIKKEIADAKVEQGWNTMIPTLSYNGNYTRLSNNIEPFKIAFPGGDKVLNPQILNQYTNRISLQEPIFVGMKGNYALKGQIQQALATQSDYRKDMADVKLNIINQYLSLYKFYQSKKILEENLKLALQRERDIQNMVNTGMALENDVFKARLAKSNLEVSLAELDNAISNTVYGLNINLGLPEETILVTDETSAIYTPDTAGMAGGLAQSHSFRDEIKAQEIREKALTYQLKSVKGNYFPTLSLGANYYLNNPNQRVFPLENKFKATWDLGATLNWNFTQLYTSKANVREAKANLEQAKVGKKQLEDGIKLESRQTLNAWKLCQRKISLAQLTIEQAIENQRIVQNRFNNNTALATDLLDADNALVQAKLNLLNAKADASAAYYKALRVAGK